MSRTVIFLGAGASKALGLPITREIFPMLLDRLMSQPPGDKPLFGGDTADQKCLKRCLDGILPGLNGATTGCLATGFPHSLGGLAPGFLCSRQGER
jgi:hypothetical protein